MIATIDDFELADGTLEGGYALGDVNISVERIFDIVNPLAAAAPVLFDRQLRRTTVTFTVARVHESAAAAEIYIAVHDATIPSSGNVFFTTTFGDVRYLQAAKVFSDLLNRYIGKTTFHAYTIIGGIFNPAPFSYILMEDSGYVLAEDGFKIPLEH